MNSSASCKLLLVKGDEALARRLEKRPCAVAGDEAGERPGEEAGAQAGAQAGAAAGETLLRQTL